VIPDRPQSLALHTKFGSADRIVRHCSTVATVSEKIADAIIGRGIPLDRQAVLAGALLHDIGRSRVQTVDHGYVGAEILRAEGVDAVVVEIVKRHVGAGISPEEVRSLGFPEGDYIPRTLEEKVVCFSDKMVSSDSVQPFEEEERRYIRKGHDVERLRRLRDDVAKELGQDPGTLLLPVRARG
jgi:uncharacterized protein (TIGR00295 family)